MLENSWAARLRRQRELIVDGTRHFVVFVGYSEGGPKPQAEPIHPPWASGTLSEEYLEKHAYELGVIAAHHAYMWMNTQEASHDDTIPNIFIGWGTGADASLFTGLPVSFQEGTSYSLHHPVETWDDIDKLAFDPENRFVKWELEFWRGVESRYVEGISVTPHCYRSPLDLANDLRGNRIFEDMYLEPEQVDRLVAKCAELTIDADRYLRRNSRVLREAPGGIWSCALPEPGMLGINGDPVDLISPEMGERFNKPSMERLIQYAGSAYFHHHTLGITRFQSVAKTRGPMVQQYTPDPKCRQVYEVFNERWVETSKKMPFDIWQNFNEAKDGDRVLEMMSQGRFCIRAWFRTLTEARQFIDKVRKFDS